MQPSLFDLGHDPAPFYRWTGNKRQYVQLILALLGSLRGREYRECFLGSGSVALQVLCDQVATRVWVNDSNVDLVATWTALRSAAAEVLALYLHHREQSSESYYYEVRAIRSTTAVERAARFLYLVGASHCGLWRENQSGEMNAPYGHACELFTEEWKLRDAAQLLQSPNLVITAGGFEACFKHAQGVVIFADPPYLPLDETSFTAYSGKKFGVPEHRTLAELARGSGALVAVCNHDTPLAREIYAGAKVLAMNANRGFNAENGAKEAIFLFGE